MMMMKMMMMNDDQIQMMPLFFLCAVGERL